MEVGSRYSMYTVKGQLTQIREVGEKVGECLEQGQMGWMVITFTKLDDGTRSRQRLGLRTGFKL